MNMRLSLAALSICLVTSLSARASDLSYTITGGTLSPTGSFFGSFLINSNNELLDGASITAIAPGGGTTYSFFASGNTSSIPGAANLHDSMGDTFRLNLNGGLSSLMINTLASNGPTTDTALILASGLQYNATGGAIAAVPIPSSTPEPSSLLLLGTGALGVAGSLRRRLVNA